MSPHGILKPLDPPGSNRRWQCQYCGAAGLLDDVRKIECSHVYPPCEYCGQTPECSPACAGIMAALAAPGVHVVGMKKPKLPRA